MTDRQQRLFKTRKKTDTLLRKADERFDRHFGRLAGNTRPR